MKYEKACGAVIIYDKHILLVHQQNGLWGFPKGHVEPRETEEQTTIREVKEETGLDIIVNPNERHQFCYYIQQFEIHKTVVLFTAQLSYIPQQVTLQPEEIKEVEWVPFAKVEKLLTFPEWKQAWQEIYANFLLDHPLIFPNQEAQNNQEYQETQN